MNHTVKDLKKLLDRYDDDLIVCWQDNALLLPWSGGGYVREITHSDSFEVGGLEGLEGQTAVCLTGD